MDSLGHTTKVDVEIFHKAMERVLNPGAGPSDTHMERYFNECKKLEGFRTTIEGISGIDFYMPNEIDYLMLGMSYEEIKKFDSKSEWKEGLNETYFQFNHPFLTGDMEYEKFIGALNSYIEAAKKRMN